MPRQKIDIPSDELTAAYLAGVGTPALARRYGCTPTTIAKRLRAAGVALRDARFAGIPVAAAALRRLYLVERLPIAAIAAALGVSTSTVGNRRRAYGIPIRPRHSAAELEAAAPVAANPGRSRLRERRAVYRYLSAFA